MSKRWKRKRAQLNNLELAREAKRRDFSMNAEQEAGVLSADAMEQRGYVPPAQGELTEEGREAREETSGESSRSGLRNSNSSVEYGDGDGNDSEGSGDDGSDSIEDADYEVSQEEARSVCSEWLCAQPIGVARMMTVIMMDTLKSELRLAHMKAAEISGSVVGCSERTVRQWYADVFSGKDVAMEGRGMWKRNNVTSDEKISKKLVHWLRVETGKRNSTLNLLKVMKWLNDCLLPSLHLPENYHNSLISRTTCWRWMVSLGFEYSKYRKGYVDGHERPDVVKERKAFIQKICALESSHKPPPVCSDGIPHYPLGDESADKHLVLIYHDETTFHSNEGRNAGWHVKGEWPLLPKDQGRSIMVSDFVDEFDGFLALTEEEVKRRDEEDPTVPLLAREVIEVGAEHDGYYDSDKFCLQVAKAARIAAFKYSPSRYDVYFVFDQAKTHTAYTADALIASRMNKNPGGAQPVMRVSPFIVNGAPQRMVLPDGTPKGLKMVLEERGVNVRKMKRDEMVAKLSSFDDFKNEKNKVQRLLVRFEIQALFLPKFHPELNPIERVWGKAKVYTRDRCDYTFPSLHRMVTPALASVSLDQIRKYFRKSRDYVNAFKDGHTGYKADEVIKDYRSHRRVPETESMV